MSDISVYCDHNHQSICKEQGAYYCDTVISRCSACNLLCRPQSAMEKECCRQCPEYAGDYDCSKFPTTTTTPLPPTTTMRTTPEPSTTTTRGKKGKGKKSRKDNQVPKRKKDKKTSAKPIKTTPLKQTVKSTTKYFSSSIAITSASFPQKPEITSQYVPPNAVPVVASAKAAFNPLLVVTAALTVLIVVLIIMVIAILCYRKKKNDKDSLEPEKEPMNIPCNLENALNEKEIRIQSPGNLYVEGIQTGEEGKHLIDGKSDQLQPPDLLGGNNPISDGNNTYSIISEKTVS